MAAYAALLSLMHIIDDIEHHHSPPISMDKKQVQSLTENVAFLQEFLQRYSSSVADDDDEADPLEMRIIDAAYAAQDIIELNIVDVIKLSRSTSGEQNDSGSSSGEEVNSREEVNCINLYEDLHQVIEEMDLIMKVAMKIDVEKEVSASLVSLTSSSSSSSSWQNTSSMMVCSDDVLHGIMEKLVAGWPDRQVIPIVGMGGIGKTTLARTVYSKPLIKEYFDICVWATISQQFNIRETLCQLLSQKGYQSESCEQELGLELYKNLFGRRFLIVMDDMWSIDAWEKIQRFFPDNENGRRILVTTRLSPLSSQLNNNYSLQMRFLDESSSWDLFSNTVFGEESCPLELVEIGKEIVKNCRGLPLSIVVVGGVLKKMGHTQGCWESIRNNLASVVNLDNDKHCLRLLKMSYNHLPVYLKPCFLYMGVFEEDHRIPVSRLIKLWISEGFLKPMNGKILETVAKGFLKDLIDRNLILIDGLGCTGNVKYCKIHDLLRDLCLRESLKYGFYHVIGRGSPHGINRQQGVVIPNSISEQKVIDELQSMSHNTRSAICQEGKLPWCRNFGLLRTLDSDLTLLNHNYVDSHVFECVNLRHLSAKFGRKFSFPLPFNLIWNLHTLIVYCAYECNAPVGIWKMPQFRHIEFITESGLCLPDPPSDGGDDGAVMENLHTLKGVKNFKCGEEVVKKIPNVRKLEIRYGHGDDDYCVSNIKCLCKLESLQFIGAASLHKLTFPQSLKSLTLWMRGNEFKWENMLEKLGWLPLLQKLELCYGCFGRGEWEIVEGQFPSLKFLSLVWCDGLKNWTAQESSIFPRLEYLHLYRLLELKEIPSEIGNIPTLQKMHLECCSESAVMSAKAIVDEQVELQGEQLPFHVKVQVSSVDKAQLSLAGSNFEVNVL